MNIIKPTDEFMSHVRETQKYVKKKSRKQYIKEHIFQILSLILSTIAIIVSIFGLYLPKSEQVSQLKPNPEATYQSQDQP